MVPAYMFVYKLICSLNSLGLSFWFDLLCLIAYAFLCEFRIPLYVQKHLCDGAYKQRFNEHNLCVSCLYIYIYTCIHISYL